MFKRFLQKNSLKNTAQQIYGSIVTQARNETFYRSLNVPDTIEGRFDMIILHIFIWLQNAKKQYGTEDELNKLIIEEFFAELESSLREMGVGDISVPKRMQKLADAFYGRLYAYSEGIEDEENPQKLIDAIKRNLYAIEETQTEYDRPQPNGLEAMTNNAQLISNYIRQSAKLLASQDQTVLRSGEIVFYNPHNLL